MATMVRILNLSHPLELISHPVDGRILEMLSRADTAFTGRQIHIGLGQGSARGVQLGLARLHRQGIVLAEPAGRAILYRLNHDHLAAVHVRALAHLRHELLGRLRSEFESWDPRPLVAYLFGSTARRESNAESDIDICLVRPAEVVDPDSARWRNQVDALARAVTSWTGNDTRVVEFGEEEARTGASHDPLLASIRDQGIHLVGDESVLRP